MPLPTNDNDWDWKSGSRDYFDNNSATPTWSPNQDASPELKDVARNLSQTLGVSTGNGYLGLSGGYIYEYAPAAYKGNHAGIDFAAGVNTSIKAVVSGTIENVSNQAAGSFIAVRGNDGKRWIYGHVNNSRGFVTGQNQTIQAGQEVGTVFNQAAPHLHLEVHTDFSAPATGFFQNSGTPASIAVLQQKTMSPLQAYWQSKNGGGGGTTPTPGGTPTPGNDNITGDAGNNNINSLAGNDTVSGAAGNDTINGNSGNDQLFGNDGNDSLMGWTGNDTVTGGNGNDVLDAFYYSGLSGNGEIDYLRGDVGIDTFVIGDSYGKGYLGNSYAVIEDFKWQDDIIKIQGSLSQYALKPGNLYGFSANDTAIVLSSNNSEVLAIARNVSTANSTIRYSSSDFLSA